MEAEIRVPSVGEVSSLPRRAAAACAARIARRLFVVATEHFPNVFDQATSDRADRLIEVAESLASFSDMRDWPKHRYFSFGEDTQPPGMNFFLGEARKFEFLSPPWAAPQEGQRFRSDDATKGFS